jgi:hypothetical protein
MTKFSCCEVCDRNPTCGTDCGSCDVPMGAPESAEERAAVVASMLESAAGVPAVPHDEVVRRIGRAAEAGDS